MAQLYKMTLYVCDLEESLTPDEIETLIKQDALDGVAVNCLCHFADWQIGDCVEWDDDIDLNQYGCPTSAWDKYFKQTKVEVNFYDKEETYPNCTVQVLTNTVTGDVSVGWWKNSDEVEFDYEAED